MQDELMRLRHENQTLRAEIEGLRERSIDAIVEVKDIDDAIFNSEVVYENKLDE